MGDYIIIHRRTEFKGTHVEKDGIIQGCSPMGNLCNPYDEGGVKTGDNIDVTCKNCLRIMEAKKKLIGYEITIKETKRGGWKEHIPQTRYGKDFMEKVDKIIDKYGAETKGSFKVIYKTNGGYGKNKKNGATIIHTWKGKLNMIYSITDLPDPNDKPTLLDEYYEEGHKAFQKKEEPKECESCNGTGWKCHSDHVEMHGDCEDDYNCDDCLKKGDECYDCYGTGHIDPDDETIEKVWQCSDCGKMKPRWHRRNAKCDDCGSTKFEQDGVLRWDVPKDKGVDS